MVVPVFGACAEMHTRIGMSCHANFSLRYRTENRQFPGDSSAMAIPQGQHDDRRSHPRYKFVKAVEVHAAKRVIKGFAVDIGQGGISFIIDSILAPGNVIVEIPEVQLTLEGKILNHQPTSNAGLYRHQMQFKEMLLNAVLEEILT